MGRLSLTHNVLYITSDTCLEQRRHLQVMAYQCLVLQQVSNSTTHFLANQVASAILDVRNQSMKQLVS